MVIFLRNIHSKHRQAGLLLLSQMGLIKTKRVDYTDPILILIVYRLYFLSVFISILVYEQRSSF